MFEANGGKTINSLFLILDMQIFDAYRETDTPNGKGIVRIEKYSDSYLRTDKKLKNPREEAVKYALISLQVPSYYEYMTFPLQYGRAYFPDFITSIMVNGRQVILEPHGSIDYNYLKKLNEFILTYNFYIILISNKRVDDLIRYDGGPTAFVDSYWFIDGFENTEEDIIHSFRKIKRRLKKLLKSEAVETL